MNIDHVFQRSAHEAGTVNLDKSNYYLGTISEVSAAAATIQIENLSILQGRIFQRESFVPGGMNYMIIVASENGIFIGRVKRNAIKDSESIHVLMKTGKLDAIYPQTAAEMLAYIPPFMDVFRPTGFSSVAIHDKVYLAPEEVITRYYQSLEVLDSAKGERSLIPFATLAVKSNLKIGFKPATLFSRHLMIIGSTGSGKSTSALSILDKASNDGEKILIIDPTGEYKDTFDENEIDKLHLGEDTCIVPGSVSIDQWIDLLQASPGIQAPSLMNAILALRFQWKNDLKGEVYQKIGTTFAQIETNMANLSSEDTNFNFTCLEQQMLQESVSEKKYSNGELEKDYFKANANRPLVERLQQFQQSPMFRKLFADASQNSLTERLDAFFEGKRSLYVDASTINSGDQVGQLIVDFICRRIEECKQREQQAFILFIDEVHRYVKRQTNDGSLVEDGLTTLAREGRKLGVYLLLTTQSPNDVSKILIAQMGSMLIHRLTQPDELFSIKNYLDEDSRHQIQKLDQGEAILTSVNLMHDIQLKMDKSKRSHANSSPSLQCESK